MTRVARLSILAAFAALAGCDGVQTSLGGQGEHGRQFITLFTIFMAVCAVMYLLVIAALVAGLLRRRRDDAEANVVENRAHHRSSPVLKPLLIGWLALIAVGLGGLGIASYAFDRADAGLSPSETLWVDLTANQWWWDVNYVATTASANVRTANELHLPVGVPTRIRLKSNDVIHSLWVPNLAGKQDLIPGRVTDITLLPTKTGYYRGACAEFCGVQHAHMNLDVVVHSREDFLRWYSAQLQPAAPPRTALAQAGHAYVTNRECRMCHTISGTPANGKMAPDLTHVASRRSLAAGTLPMTRGHLYAWVADPQSQKPGNKLPTIALEPNELHALVAYLEGLK
jgi:cytochrome c oxidase subunit 2